MYFVLLKNIYIFLKILSKLEMLLNISCYSKNMFFLSRDNIKVKSDWVFCVIKKVYSIFQVVMKKWDLIDYFVLLKKTFFFQGIT